MIFTVVSMGGECMEAEFDSVERGIESAMTKHPVVVLVTAFRIPDTCKDSFSAFLEDYAKYTYEQGEQLFKGGH